MCPRESVSTGCVGQQLILAAHYVAHKVAVGSVCALDRKRRVRGRKLCGALDCHCLRQLRKARFIPNWWSLNGFAVNRSKKFHVLFLVIMRSTQIHAKPAFEVDWHRRSPCSGSQHWNKLVRSDALCQFRGDDHRFVPHSARTLVRSFRIRRRTDNDDEISVGDTLLHKIKPVSAGQEVPLIESYSDTALSLQSLG